MNFGKRLKEARERQDLSQKLLGAVIGINGVEIDRFEREDVNLSIDVVIKLADALNVSIDYLVGKVDIEDDQDTLSRFRHISMLPEDDKNFMLRTIDSLLKGIKTQKPSLTDTVEDLKNSNTMLRRRAAVKLRRLKSTAYCEPIFQALEIEIRNTRNEAWENKYHLIMALGESGCQVYLGELQNILINWHHYPMVRIALADAITRLQQDTQFLINSLKEKDIDLVEGSLRAVALEQISIDDKLILKLIDFITQFPDRDLLKWITAVISGSKNPILIEYLEKLAENDNGVLAKAASSSLNGEYIEWDIL